MTVIKDKQNYKYPRPGSTDGSDIETLELGDVSDNDTENNNEPVQNMETNNNGQVPIRIRIHRPKIIKPSQVEEVVRLKSNSGKKKLRRYQNRCILQTLSEEEENENMVVIMESHKGPFARLLDNKDALEYWQEFVEKSEEEQSELIRALTAKYHNETVVERCQSESPGRISSRIRTFKIKKNLSLEIVQVCEEDLIQFFKAKPEDTYVKNPPTSFERLLIHAVAQYHKLQSVSVIVDEGTKKSVKVYNNNKNWSPASCYLTDFIKKLRK
ncbi:R3H domain-containing protein 4-like [Diorhabda carinulata]|uniref:R3H domain-containing protein 4-like n=1 Tax=Diorhabda carinulata TaxID=1163345 RepID=UPI0025A1B182|nr:R3H domain-containing protein 4-like [Diorhabda carinulata]